MFRLSRRRKPENILALGLVSGDKEDRIPSIKRRTVLVTLVRLAVGLPVLGVFLLWLDSYFIPSDLSPHLQSCTYQHLLQAFPPHSSTQSTNSTTCWKLRDEMLQIPVNAIVNRNHMHKLGSGYKGGVHEAIIEASGGQCRCAIKTDHCHSFTTNPFFDRSGRSCIKDWSMLWNDASYLAGEYTGALLTVAARKAGLSSSGLLPTFGVVVRPTPLVTRVARGNLQGAPLDDGRIVGVVMPIWSFHTLKTETERRGSVFVESATALQFLGQMGMAHQDMLPGNIGVMDDDNDKYSTSFLCDFTYLSVQKDVKCTAKEEACNYCWEDAFATVNYTNHRIPRMSAIESDLVAYRNAIGLQFISSYPLLKRKICATQRIDKLIEVLREDSG